VVVDVRNNPGGLLTAAIHLSSDFVKGTVVKQATEDGSVSSLGVDHAGRLTSIPMAVLVNGGSASASEIFAGAMRDSNRGKVVGEKSFGKGTVQDVVNFPGGSSLHVTIAKWLTPNGDSIHGIGITPDITAVNKTDNKVDLQLQKALDLL
jgi:carboxyl-terminal processing protease